MAEGPPWPKAPLAEGPWPQAPWPKAPWPKAPSYIARFHIVCYTINVVRVHIDRRWIIFLWPQAPRPKAPSYIACLHIKNNRCIWGESYQKASVSNRAQTEASGSRVVSGGSNVGFLLVSFFMFFYIVSAWEDQPPTGNL